MEKNGGPCFACGKPVEHGSMIHASCKRDIRPVRVRAMRIASNYKGDK